MIYSLCQKLFHPVEPDAFSDDAAHDVLPVSSEVPLDSIPQPLYINGPNVLASKAPSMEPMVIDKALIHDHSLSSTGVLSNVCQEPIILEMMDMDPNVSDLGHCNDMNPFPSSMDAIPTTQARA